MKIVIAGATGFTGSHLVKELAERGHELKVIIREASDISSIRQYTNSFKTCNLNNISQVADALSGSDVFVNLVNLGTGMAKSLVPAVEYSGIKKSVFISTTGIFTTLNPTSKAVRLEAERIINDSNLEYTIIRPTMIYGTPRDRNIWRLINWIKRKSIIAIVGSGEFKSQPVHVDDLAWLISEAIECNISSKKTYNASGGTEASFNELVDMIALHLEKKIFKVGLPLKPIHASLSLVEKLGVRLPIRSEQFLRLNEDKIFSHFDAKNDLKFNPRSLDEGIKQEVLFLNKAL